MARLPRFVLVGHPQHVIIRGNNREPIFYADEDYQYYLEKLKKACDKEEVSGSRYTCTQCHVPQSGAKPLVENTYSGSSK